MYIIEIFSLQLQPNVDLSHIIEQSLDMLEEGTHEFTNEDYFSFYTNNIPIAIIIYWVFYIGKIIMGEAFQYSIVGGLFNVIMIWIGFLYTLHRSRHMFRCHGFPSSKSVLQGRPVRMCQI